MRHPHHASNPGVRFFALNRLGREGHRLVDDVERYVSGVDRPDAYVPKDCVAKREDEEDQDDHGPVLL